MVELGCYDTRDPISALLVEQLRIPYPTKVLDLGSGQGSLLHAARSRWPKSAVHAAEIDPHRHQYVQLRFPDIRIIQTDGLHKNLALHLEVDEGSIDVAVCNPPYLRSPATEDCRALLEAVGLNCRFRVITTELLFLAQNLRLLRPGGELGIILPDGLLTGKEFVALRETLLEQHELFGVIQLPDKAFSRTEARTHILLLRRGGTSQDALPLHKASVEGKIISTVRISKADAATRMDHDYWRWRSACPITAGITLETLGADIRRGSYLRIDLTRQGFSFFHTSDFPSSFPYTVNLDNTAPPLTGVTAQTGDILLARVGKRCIGRVALVSSGQALFTDCVYRIRLPEAWRQPAWKALLSDAGQAWLRAQAHGVCAQVISKSDLLAFPVATTP